MKKEILASKSSVMATEKLKKKEWYKSANIPYFSVEEMKILIENLIYEPYYESLILALYESGARVSELLDLCVKDFSQANSTLSLKTLKQRNSTPIRVIRISQELSDLLAKQILEKELSYSDYLFAKRKEEKAVSRQAVYERFKKLVLETLGGDYSDRVNPHALRHSRAIHFLTYSKNSNIALLSKFLGHSNISNTMIYLRYTNKEMNNTLDELNNTIHLFS